MLGLWLSCIVGALGLLCEAANGQCAGSENSQRPLDNILRNAGQLWTFDQDLTTVVVPNTGNLLNDPVPNLTLSNINFRRSGNDCVKGSCVCFSGPATSRSDDLGNVVFQPTSREEILPPGIGGVPSTVSFWYKKEPTANNLYQQVFDIHMFDENNHRICGNGGNLDEMYTMWMPRESINRWVLEEECRNTDNSPDNIGNGWPSFDVQSGWNDGIWHMATIVDNRSNIKLFIDGVDTNLVGQSPGEPISRRAYFRLASGNFYAEGSNAIAWEGCLDDFMIFYRGLSDCEVSELYNKYHYTQSPTPAPTRRPTRRPTPRPTHPPTRAPSTLSPTPAPTPRPTERPTLRPTLVPTTSPATTRPTSVPTSRPTGSPLTTRPTGLPTVSLPTESPVTLGPSVSPTHGPSQQPTLLPTVSIPTSSPSLLPTYSIPTGSPSRQPTSLPSRNPTKAPTMSSPTTSPTTAVPSITPTSNPTGVPTLPAQNQSSEASSSGDGVIIIVVIVVLFLLLVMAVIVWRKYHGKDEDGPSNSAFTRSSFRFGRYSKRVSLGMINNPIYSEQSAPERVYSKIDYNAPTDTSASSEYSEPIAEANGLHIENDYSMPLAEITYDQPLNKGGIYHQEPPHVERPASYLVPAPPVYVIPTNDGGLYSVPISSDTYDMPISGSVGSEAYLQPAPTTPSQASYAVPGASIDEHYMQPITGQVSYSESSSRPNAQYLQPMAGHASYSEPSSDTDEQYLQPAASDGSYAIPASGDSRYVYDVAEEGPASTQLQEDDFVHEIDRFCAERILSAATNNSPEVRFLVRRKGTEFVVSSYIRAKTRFHHDIIVVDDFQRFVSREQSADSLKEIAQIVADHFKSAYKQSSTSLVLPGGVSMS